MKRAFLSLDAILSSKKDDIAFFFFQFVSLSLTLSKSSPLLTDSKKRACCIDSLVNLVHLCGLSLAGANRCAIA